MAGVKGKSGRHKGDIEREGYFLRLRPEVIARAERCTPLLEMQEGVRMSKAEALEHLLTMACAAVEQAYAHKETPVPAHIFPSKISGISSLSDDLHALNDMLAVVDEEELAAPVSHTNGTGAPTTQPAIPLALEPTPVTAPPVDVPPVSETPTATTPTPQPERHQPVVKTPPELSEDIVKIAEARAQHDRLSERAFIQLLFERGIYRHRAKDGSEVPLPHSTYRDWMQRAREAGLP
jgi:hypothetical protein